MKKSHIFLLVVIGIAIGMICFNADDACTYVGFNEALSMSTSGIKKEIHVVGQLKKRLEWRDDRYKRGE